jgi:hypothetical protein
MVELACSPLVLLARGIRGEKSFDKPPPHIDSSMFHNLWAISSRDFRMEAIVLDKTDQRQRAKDAKKNDRSRREKFVELAENRTRNAIRAIRTIAKLGNRNAYDFTEADVKRIAGALSKEIDALKIRMLSTGGKETVEFKLD